LDILVNFNSGIRDTATSSLITDLRQINQSYIRGWLFFDMLSSIPVNFIILANDSVKDIKLLKTLRVLKIFRLLKLLKFDVFHQLVASGSISPSLLRLCKIIAAFFYLLHLVACCYFVVAEHTCTLIDSSSQYPLETEYFCPDAWRLDLFVDIDAKWDDKYLPSLYWAILAMLGDNAKPGTNTQFLVASVFLIVGIGVFSTIIGSLSIMLTSMDAMNNAK
jgi:hypothetical protein